MILSNRLRLCLLSTLSANSPKIFLYTYRYVPILNQYHFSSLYNLNNIREESELLTLLFLQPPLLPSPSVQNVFISETSLVYVPLLS